MKSVLEVKMLLGFFFLYYYYVFKKAKTQHDYLIFANDRDEDSQHSETEEIKKKIR